MLLFFACSRKKKKSCLLGLHLFLSRLRVDSARLPLSWASVFGPPSVFGLAQLPRGNHIYREKRETEKAQTERPTTSEADRARRPSRQQLKMSTRPLLRFPAGNSPIRERGWYKFCSHENLNSRKLVPVGSGGDGDGLVSPVPVPVSPAR